MKSRGETGKKRDMDRYGMRDSKEACLKNTKIYKRPVGCRDGAIDCSQPFYFLTQKNVREAAIANAEHDALGVPRAFRFKLASNFPTFSDRRRKIRKIEGI